MAILCPSRRVLVGFLTLAAWAAGEPSEAVISPSGDVSPSYNFTDPWFVGNLTVGNFGFGSVAANGGSDLTGFSGVIGDNPNGNGVVDLSGVGTTLDLSRDLTVGDRGTGQLDIDFGALVSNRSGVIGGQADSSGTVNVTFGGRWESASNLTIGQSGTGRLNILSGGYAESNSAGVAGRDGSIGEVTVNGFGSRWVANNDLLIAGAGDATVNIEAGGEVRVAEKTSLAESNFAANAIAVVNFTAGGVLSTGELYASPLNLRGVGTINTGGLLTDLGLVFDSSRGLQQTVTLSDSFGKNIAININADPAAGAERRVFGVGYRDSGALAVRDGVVLPTDRGFLGFFAGSAGAATVAGSGSKWDIESGLFVGYSGEGTLQIEGGGSVNALSATLASFNGSSGEATITGLGSRLDLVDILWVGNYGSGRLTIDHGAEVTSVASILGYGANASAEVVVDGVSSRLDTGNLSVGFDGTATIEVSDGAVIDVDQVALVGPNVSVGSSIRFDNGTLNAGGVVASPAELEGVGVVNTAGLVSDVDLRFDANHALQQQLVLADAPGQMITVNLDATPVSAALGAGYRGDGSLAIADGRVLRSAFGSLGYHPDSSGVAEIVGTGSRWETGNLSVGSGGEGSLLIAAGAVVVGTEVVSSGVSSGSEGAILVSGVGSLLETSGELYIGQSGTGSLRIEAGGSVTADAGWVSRRLGSSGEVLVFGEGSRLETTGDLTVGAAGPSELRIFDEALVKVGGELSIEKTSFSRPSAIFLHSGGQLAIPGQHDDALFRFLIEIDGPFEALKYWDGTDWDALDNTGVRDTDFTLEYQTTGDLAGFTLLTVGEVINLPGDYNDDGTVDAADYTVWRDQVGTPSSLPNDIHAGLVGDEQYATWKANYGASTAIGSTVPESAAIVVALIAAGLGGMVAPRR